MFVQIIVCKCMTSLQGEPGPKGPHGPPGSRGVPVSRPVQRLYMKSKSTMFIFKNLTIGLL